MTSLYSLWHNHAERQPTPHTRLSSNCDALSGPDTVSAAFLNSPCARCLIPSMLAPVSAAPPAVPRLRLLPRACQAHALGSSTWSQTLVECSARLAASPSGAPQLRSAVSVGCLARVVHHGVQPLAATHAAAQGKLTVAHRHIGRRACSMVLPRTPGDGYHAALDAGSLVVEVASSAFAFKSKIKASAVKQLWE